MADIRDKNKRKKLEAEERGLMPPKSYYVYGFYDQNHKRHEVGLGSNRRVAEAKQKQIALKVANGTYGIPDKPTFSEYCQQFIERKASRVRPSTLQDYEDSIRLYFNPMFGDTKLDRITALDVQKFIDSLDNKGLAGATQAKLFRNLRHIFRQAVRLQIISTSPVDGVEQPRQQHREMQYLTPAEVQNLLETAQPLWLKTLIAVACLAGPRLGEIIALRWSDIDLNARLISVTKSYRPDGKIQPPKTGAGRRTVPICETLYILLLDYLMEYLFASTEKPETLSDETIQESVKVLDKELVFPNSKGFYLDRHRLSGQRFKKMLELTGLPSSIRFHDLRHTFAALAIEGGADLKTLSVALGHSSITITLSLYGHLYSSAYDRLVLGIERALSGKDSVFRLPIPSETEQAQLRIP